MLYLKSMHFQLMGAIGLYRKNGVHGHSLGLLVSGVFL